MSVELWHGVPGCGKSTAMRARVEADIAASGLPCIVLDPGRVEQWAGVPHVAALSGVYDHAWVRRTHVAIAADAEEEERICEALLSHSRALGGFVFVVDELREYASGRSVGESLVQLARRHRHACVSMRLGTQSIGDVRTELLAAVDTIWTGRNCAPYNLETLERRYGLDPQRVQKLGVGEFLRTHVGM